MQNTFINYFSTIASQDYTLPTEILKYATKMNAEPVSISHSYYNGMVSALVIFQPREV
jgi:hypothetical protein